MRISSARQTQASVRLTAGLTAAVAIFMLGAAWLIPVETRSAAGEIHEQTAMEVWSEMLDSIPADVPFFLTGPMLTILSIIALIASAWIIVAIARLPQ
jgi:hypothetical protein